MGTLIFQIPEIPDQTYPRYQVSAQGDVVTAVGRDFEHLLRALANLPPDAASFSIRFRFNPAPASGNVQSRLGIYVMARCWDSDLEENIRLLIQRGALRRFYKPEVIKHFEAPWDILKGACDVVRRVDAITPLHPSEYNDRIPTSYYTITPFEPSARNDYLALDSVLSEITETAIIDICVQSADVSPELAVHTAYLSQLQSINRTWEHDDDDGLDLIDYLENDTGERHSRARELKPLRYSDPLADNILRTQQRFHETLREPHLLFHIRVLAQTRAVAQLLGSVIAGLAFEGGSYRLQSYGQGDEFFADALQSIKESLVVNLPGSDTLYEGSDKALYTGLKRLTQLATVDELLGAFRLPVASLTSPRCIRKNTDPIPEEGGDFIVVGYDMEVPGMSRVLRLQQLLKHWLFSGGTGSTKTNSVLNAVIQVSKYSIPFLVLECVKTEYRILKTLRNHPDEKIRRLAETLEIYTPGNETISPYRLSPFWHKPSISIDEHIDSILASFMGAMPLSGPLPALLGEALELVYEKHPDPNDPPLMVDLVAAAHEVLDEKGYSPETHSDIKSALEVRLGVLVRRNIGKVFQCHKSIPSIDHLMKVPAIIELDRLAQDPKCLLTLFLLSSIREYLKTAPKTGNFPRYVIIIEEAHNIVSRNSQASPSPDIADPKALATETICRMLLEFRGLGVGVVIVDQHPTLVAPEVIKATTSKLAFTQVDQRDRDELGASMLFGPMEIEEIARIAPGEAFFFTEGYHKPRRVKTPNLHELFDFDTDVLNEKLLPYIKNDNWYKNAALERIISELTELRQRMDRFDDERIGIIQELVGLLSRQPQILVQAKREERNNTLAVLIREANSLKRRLLSSYRSFVRNSYTRYLTPKKGLQIQGPMIQDMKDDLTNRFESIINPDVRKSRDIINEFIERCKTAMD
jgi:hypothetical protein